MLNSQTKIQYLAELRKQLPGISRFPALKCNTCLSSAQVHPSLYIDMKTGVFLPNDKKSAQMQE
ncbi:hypothetical protein DWW47_08930 [Odoribacter splanchnicus]|jgi:hypothetical protein|nr:hypothetical protein DWW47_08930 [Odoribacter splanchnicus]